MEATDSTTSPTRGWPLIMTFYQLLMGVSAVGFLVSTLGSTAVTWFAYRQGERWAWWAVLATLLCYGLPMTLIDCLLVGWMGSVSVLEFVLLVPGTTGLVLGSRAAWGKGS